jgi:hypothetical protein
MLKAMTGFIIGESLDGVPFLTLVYIKGKCSVEPEYNFLRWSFHKDLKKYIIPGYCKKDWL